MEMCRILKIGGKALITVWAKEQKYKEKESFYISQKKKEDGLNEEIPHSDDTLPEENKDSNIHKFGKEFQKKDLVSIKV